jgi:hypothetical protein
MMSDNYGDRNETEKVWMVEGSKENVEKLIKKLDDFANDPNNNYDFVHMNKPIAP